jgi:hypothetical protein
VHTGLEKYIGDLKTWTESVSTSEGMPETRWRRISRSSCTVAVAALLQDLIKGKIENQSYRDICLWIVYSEVTPS